MAKWLTPRTLFLDVQGSSLARRIVSSKARNFTPLCVSSPKCINIIGTGDIALRGNPAMDWHPVQGGVAIFLGMLHDKETGISSGHFGLWLVCTFAIYLVLRVLELFNGLSKGALCSEPVIFKVLCIIIFLKKLRFPSHPRQEQMQATSRNRPTATVACDPKFRIFLFYFLSSS